MKPSVLADAVMLYAPVIKKSSRSPILQLMHGRKWEDNKRIRILFGIVMAHISFKITKEIKWPRLFR